MVALVGPSGGGKSTIIGLMEHFYETDSGELLVDDVPIQEYDHGYIHRKVKLLMIHGTIHIFCFGNKNYPGVYT